MAAHDQRFKVLLQEFLHEFLALFYPKLLDQLDLSRVTWLHQELYPDPPQGQLLTIDLIAQIPLRPGAARTGPGTAVQTILLHLEIEADDTVEPFRRRLYHYFHYLTTKYGECVLPIAVYLRVGLEGQGKDVYRIDVLGENVLTFRYDYVGLPGLEGQHYLGGENALGVALSALMRWPRRQRAQAAVEALDRIVASPETLARKMLLCECVQAYAPLEDDQKIELNSLLQQPQRTGVRAMIKTWREEGVEEGLKKGREEGRREAILDILEGKFAPLSETVRQRLASWPVDKLSDLSRALLNAKSLRELGLEAGSPARNGARDMTRWLTTEEAVKYGLALARQEALAEGEVTTRRAVTLFLLGQRFAPMSETVRQRVMAWPVDKLFDLGEALFAAQSLRELGLED